MKLIQLSTLEFEQRLSTEIEENPALDTINENQEKENDDFNFVNVYVAISGHVLRRLDYSNGWGWVPICESGWRTQPVS